MTSNAQRVVDYVEHGYPTEPDFGPYVLALCLITTAIGIIMFWVGFLVAGLT